MSTHTHDFSLLIASKCQQGVVVDKDLWQTFACLTKANSVNFNLSSLQAWREKNEFVGRRKAHNISYLTLSART